MVTVSSNILLPLLDSSEFGLRPSSLALRNYDNNASQEQDSATFHLQDISTNRMIVTTTVDFETFHRVLNRPGGFRDPGEPDEYCRGFQVFDKDMTGFIGVGQLKYILTNLGEKMTDEEVDELLKAVDTSSGQVNYTGKLHTRTHFPM